MVTLEKPAGNTKKPPKKPNPKNNKQTNKTKTTNKPKNPTINNKKPVFFYFSEKFPSQTEGSCIKKVII